MAVRADPYYHMKEHGMKKFYMVSSYLFVSLGALHLFFGIRWSLLHAANTNTLTIRDLPLEMVVWLTGGGLVFVFVGFFNIIAVRDAGKDRLVRYLCHTANILAVLFLSALAALDPRPLGNGGVYLGLLLATVLTLAGFRLMGRGDR